MSATTLNKDPGTSSPHNRRYRRIAILTLGTIFLLIAIIWFLYWLIWARFEVYTDDAYVNGNLVQLMAQVPGTVIAINTDDTYFVKQNQVLIKLDPSDMQIALQRAESLLAQTVRKVRQQFERVQQTNATVKWRQAVLEKAKLDLARRKGLLKERALSKEEWNHYQTALTIAKTQYIYALHAMQAAKALVENADLYTHPEVEQAKAHYKKAYLNLARTTIVAPVTGYVAKRTIQVGQQVTSNTPMLAIIPLNDVWVDANYKESQLSNIRINQPVTLYADAHEGVKYQGKIIGINPGTGSAFSLLPPQNATGNWIKIVQRLPVRIKLEPAQLEKHPLQLGLSMQVTTDIHDIKGERLAKTPLNHSLYSTDVYSQQLSKANTNINNILNKNSPNMFMAKKEKIVE